jgi:multiple sugar transport system permease protein
MAYVETIVPLFPSVRQRIWLSFFKQTDSPAWIDDASMMTTLTRTVVPLMRPGLAVVFIFVFIGAWDNLFVPFILLLSPDKQPAAVSIFSFFGQYGTAAYGQLAAFSILYSVPILS